MSSSRPLSAPTPISRPKALEAIWKHIHAAELQKPADLRIIYAYDKLRAVAGADVITMYALEELIRPHLAPITWDPDRPAEKNAAVTWSRHSVMT